MLSTTIFTRLFNNKSATHKPLSQRTEDAKIIRALLAAVQLSSCRHVQPPGSSVDVSLSPSYYVLDPCAGAVTKCRASGRLGRRSGISLSRRSQGACNFASCKGSCKRQFVYSSSGGPFPTASPCRQQQLQRCRNRPRGSAHWRRCRVCPQPRRLSSTLNSSSVKISFLTPESFAI